ncbi:MAG: hypothetical protein NVSMB57_15990 [Actinomycetota bacterium]
MNAVSQGSAPYGMSARGIAFACSAAAAGIHLGAVHAHTLEWAPAAGFMLLSGVAQLAWALALLGPRRPWLLEAGIVGNASIVALWIVSRTVGLPMGPMRWTPEHIDANDLIATLLEILVLVVTIRSADQSRPAPHPMLSRLCVLGVLAAVTLPGHDQPHEQAATLATLAIAGVAGFARPLFASLVHVDWRNYVKEKNRTQDASVHPADAGGRASSEPVSCAGVPGGA